MMDYEVDVDVEGSATYKVQAESKEEAIKLVLSGEGELVSEETTITRVKGAWK